jgi:hypothetical protein
MSAARFAIGDHVVAKLRSRPGEPVALSVHGQRGTVMRRMQTGCLVEMHTGPNRGKALAFGLWELQPDSVVQPA